VRNVEGEIVGAVEVFSDATHAVQIEKLNESLRQLIHVDPLTRIPNRLALIESLEREFQRYRRYGTVFSVVFADIDHFKKVNDTFGHAAGDGALQWFARKISTSLRKADLVGRYGGEEFLVILPATDAQAATQTAEHLRAHLAAAPCPYTESTITASFGVTAVNSGDRIESLIDRADAALYVSKRQGRNRVTCL
jgi:diguanylate cyclase (GGDEF)-like protein